MNSSSSDFMTTTLGWTGFLWVIFDVKIEALKKSNNEEIKRKSGESKKLISKETEEFNLLKQRGVEEKIPKLDFVRGSYKKGNELFAWESSSCKFLHKINGKCKFFFWNVVPLQRENSCFRRKKCVLFSWFKGWHADMGKFLWPLSNLFLISLLWLWGFPISLSWMYETFETVFVRKVRTRCLGWFSSGVS